MERNEFFPILECALRSADPSVVEVSQDPSDADEVRVFLNDCSTIRIGVRGLSLLDILGIVAVGVSMEHRKDWLEVMLGAKKYCK